MLWPLTAAYACTLVFVAFGAWLKFGVQLQARVAELDAELAAATLLIDSHKRAHEKIFEELRVKLTEHSRWIATATSNMNVRATSR